MSTREMLYQLVGLVGVIGVIRTISAQSPVHRITYLIQLYLVGAMVYVIQDQYFQGQTYIIVYVGAIAILFIFTVMMVNIDLVQEERRIEIKKYLLQPQDKK